MYRIKNYGQIQVGCKIYYLDLIRYPNGNGKLVKNGSYKFIRR